LLAIIPSIDAPIPTPTAIPIDKLSINNPNATPTTTPIAR